MEAGSPEAALRAPHTTMKLRVLRYFIVLAEELHFGRAADRLAITQPPLSVAIKALEDELGVQLLKRDSKHAQLTEAGSAFLAEARQIMERAERAGDIAKAVAAGLRGRLDIGVTGAMFYREIPSIVKRYEEVVPDMEVSLREMTSAEQINALLHNQVHVGFVNMGTVPPPLASISLDADEFVCCLSSSHPMAKERTVELANLTDEQWVMFARDVAPTYHDNVIAVLSTAGIHPRTRHAARQWLTVVAMVANGMGVALVPSFLTRVGFKGVRFVKLHGLTAGSPASLAWNPGHSSAAVDTFVATSQEVLGESRGQSR